MQAKDLEILEPRTRAKWSEWLESSHASSPGVWVAVHKKARVERLVEQGRMTPAGLAAVEAAKANGSWSSLDRVEALEVPEDLAQALADAEAAEEFERLAPSQRKMALYWVSEAKRPATRQARIDKTVSAALLGRPPF